VSQERTEAVVLRGVDFSETSRIVTFLTPDRGRLTCMARGVRRKKSPLAATLDTFNRIEIVYYWKDGRAVQNLGEAALLDGFGGIKADLDKATFAALPLELVYRVAHENEPSFETYAAFVHGLESLTRWDGDARAHMLWQVLQLLSVAGFEPTLDTCVACGCDVETPHGFAYEGGATCGSCRPDVRLTPEQAADLRALARSRDACPAIANAAALYPLVHRYAARQIEADLRSVRVIDQMFT